MLDTQIATKQCDQLRETLAIKEELIDRLYAEYVDCPKSDQGCQAETPGDFERAQWLQQENAELQGHVQQLKDAMNVNGGDVENATTGDYVMHFLTFGFKIVFALIPPAGLGGGWPCFFVSLGMIGVLTAIVGDLAGIFGCLVGLKDSVTGG